MTIAVALLAYAGLVAMIAPRALRRDSVIAAPRVGVVAWQSSVFAVLGAVVLLAMSSLVPVERVSFDLGHLLHACAARLSSVSEAGPSGLTSGAALLAGASALLRLTWVLARHVHSLAGARRRQRSFIALLGARADDGADLIDSDVRAAYCVPGGRGHIVLTRGAAEALSEAQRAAVLAHEQAHLRGRHDLALLGADVAARAFGFVPVFRLASQELRVLLEMVADDAAARVSGRGPLVAALEGLDGGASAPRGALGATGLGVSQRIVRLTQEPPAVSSGRTALAVGISALVLLLPWLIVAAPAWAAHTGLCLGG